MIDFDILYEDNHIIVVNKPYNVLSQSDATKDTDMLSILKKYIKEKYGKPGNVYLGLVHRLDRPVSGVMAFAKTSKAAARLAKEIKDGVFNKEYIAVVRGANIASSGEFTDYLLKLDDGNSVIGDCEKGKLSKLTYEVVDKLADEDLVLVKIKLITGRHHQIRVQFSSRGYPLYGDQRYGRRDNKQIALLAYKLTLRHPVTKETMSFIVNSYGKNEIWKKFDMRKLA